MPNDNHGPPLADQFYNKKISFLAKGADKVCIVIK
jgi:hypothetical protein